VKFQKFPFVGGNDSDMNDRVLLDADIREPLFDYLEKY
jgi:hypothetical protein